MSDSDTRQRRGEFDDALKGYYHDHDEILPDENTDYRSLNAESVGSLILGFLSILTFVSMLFVIFPIMGIVLGAMAIRKILRATQELEGLGVASAGVGLSVLLATAGTSYQVYISQYEVPAGYVPINFSMLLADAKTGRIPEDILTLAQPFQDEHGNTYEKRVFIEGYMYPTKQLTEIKNFMLVPSVEQGQFGSLTRNPTQMVDVTLSGDLRAAYRSGPVKVGGTLIVKPDLLPGATPYSLKADVFR
ncbi:MAG: hypothetical protein LBI05_00265 [Planctomycetaceae bacterium]|jgi:hypothetical protein|nr:hypothetical protein [Planctomycetaceae bacterium]